MDKLRDEFIKQELMRRIAALKILNSSFDVDNICFTSKVGSDWLAVIGDIEKLAKIMGAEIYETENSEGKTVKAFEYDNVEVWSVV